MIRPTLGAAVVALALAGCARAGIEVTVDLYAKEPLGYRRLTDTDLQNLRIGIANAIHAGDDIADGRTRLGRNLLAAYDAYHQFYMAVTDPKTPPAQSESVKNLAGYLPEYERAVEQQRQKVRSSAEETEKKVTGYRHLASVTPLESQKNALKLVSAEEALTLAVTDLQTQLRTLSGDLGTSFEKAFRAILRVAPISLNPDKLQPLAPNLLDRAQSVLGAFKSLNDTVSSLRARGMRVSTALVLPAGLTAADAPAESAGTLGQTIAAAARVMFTIDPAVGLSETGATALGQLGASLDLYNTQIDRLQDPADPVWREVTAPDNSQSWNRQFARTFFLAEGDSSIVIARDRLGHFRVQRAKNNPAALVQGQLRISRAIASALADVLAAATGAAGLAGALPGIKPPSPETETPKVENLAQEAAKVDATLRFRQSVRSSLADSLEIVRRTIQARPGDDMPEDLRTQLIAVLDGYKPVFTLKRE